MLPALKNHYISATRPNKKAFNDFKDACNALLNDDAHKDRLNQLFLAASQDSSGATITTINKGE